MNALELRAMRAVITAILNAINDAGPLGAPSSAIFLALQAHGATNSMCTSIINQLDSMGLVVITTDCIRLTVEGQARLRELSPASLV